jgi:serine/threonine-protein phosphatase 5
MKAKISINYMGTLVNMIQSFEGEVKAKYDDKVYELFQTVFNSLPLGYVLNKKVMVVHGV